MKRSKVFPDNCAGSGVLLLCLGVQHFYATQLTNAITLRKAFIPDPAQLSVQVSTSFQGE